MNGLEDAKKIKCKCTRRWLFFGKADLSEITFKIYKRNCLTQCDHSRLAFICFFRNIAFEGAALAEDGGLSVNCFLL